MLLFPLCELKEAPTVMFGKVICSSALCCPLPHFSPSCFHLFLPLPFFCFAVFYEARPGGSGCLYLIEGGLSPWKSQWEPWAVLSLIFSRVTAFWSGLAAPGDALAASTNLLPPCASLLSLARTVGMMRHYFLSTLPSVPRCRALTLLPMFLSPGTSTMMDVQPCLSRSSPFPLPAPCMIVL